MNDMLPIIFILGNYILLIK